MSAPVTTPETPLTQRQAEVLEAIRSLTAMHGYPPTIRELCAVLGISSPNGVYCHLPPLKKRGLITQEAKLSRSIRIVGDADPVIRERDRCARLVEAHLADNAVVRKLLAEIRSGKSAEPVDNSESVM